jgi:hypothetical protein
MCEQGVLLLFFKTATSQCHLKSEFLAGTENLNQKASMARARAKICNSIETMYLDVS